MVIAIGVQKKTDPARDELGLSCFCMSVIVLSWRGSDSSGQASVSMFLWQSYLSVGSFPFVYISVQSVGYYILQKAVFYK